MKKWTCIEVGFAKWQIWHINRKGVSLARQIDMPEDALWVPAAMARRLGEIQGKLLFLLNIAQTSIRLADSPFPFEENYIFSRNTIGGHPWTTALPAEISESLVEMCRLMNLRPGRIKAIDTLEYRMACYFASLYKSPCWLIIPQEPGIRLIALDNGLPLACCFFSNDPDYRLKELTRIWLCQASPPQHAILLGGPEHFWIRDFLQEKSVQILEPDNEQSFVQAMLEA